MKKRNLWTILLLVSISFSVLNGFVIEANETDHCTVQEYVQEFSQSNQCGDLCDLRHMFYIGFILPDNRLIFVSDSSFLPTRYFQYSTVSDFISPAFRPPIAA